MIIPGNLAPTEAERNEHMYRSSRLAKVLSRIFKDSYGLETEISCRGSTQKGTSLSERFVAVDYDMSITGTPETIDALALRSNLFEGCQMFRVGVGKLLEQYLGNIFHAGHRVSSIFEGRPFDLSFADVEKDQWKIDFNTSDVLDFSQAELEDVRKAKYFFKKTGVYGSPVYGIVGPACELAIHHLCSFERMLAVLGEMSQISSPLADYLETMPFPEEYYSLFPKNGNHVVEGLKNSFRLTTPATWNRILHVVGEHRGVAATQQDHVAVYSLPLDFRLTAMVLRPLLKKGIVGQPEIISMNGSTVVSFAKVNELDAVGARLVAARSIPERGSLSSDDIRILGLDLPADVRPFRGLPDEHVPSTIDVPIEVFLRRNWPDFVELYRGEFDGAN